MLLDTEMEPQGVMLPWISLVFGRPSRVEFKKPLSQLTEQLELMPAKSTVAAEARGLR